MNHDLSLLRSEIDQIDRQIVELVAKRFGVIERVAAVKAAHQIPARIQSRIDTVIQRREAAGRGLGLPRRTAANIWKVIVEEACKYEEDSIEQLMKDNKL